MSGIVVVGAGVAAMALVRELRRRDPAVPIQVLTQDAGDYYYKPRLSNAFSRGQTRVELVQAERAALERSLDFRIEPHSEVARLDLAAGKLEVDGRARRYQRLVLALGAGPLRPPLPGLTSRRVFFLNHLDDYERLRQQLVNQRRILIIGAGLIGCELGNDLALAGHTVALTDLAPRPLARLVSPELSARLHTALAALGVHWALSRRITQLVEDGTSITALFGDGGYLEADLVICAAGVMPRVALAREAGLVVARGIVVDATSTTSAPGVHALGDCAERPEGWLPFVAPLAHTVPALAATLLGTPTAAQVPRLPVQVKTRSFPLLVLPPPPDAAGDWETRRSSADADERVFRSDQGHITGFSLGGEAVRTKDLLLAEVHRP